MWSSIFLIICLMANSQRSIMANPVMQESHVDSLVRRARALPETQLDNEDLTKTWQDRVLANLIAVNYFNRLLVLTSRVEFPFTVPDGYSIRYIQNSGSFYGTISQLATEIRQVLTDARQDLNHVHSGMERVPENLKTMTLLVKQAPYELLLSVFPNSFNDIDQLVNNSLVILRNPQKNFQQVLNLLTEIDYLLTVGSNDQWISLQVSDVKAQWALLTELMTELANQAERTRETFILQFNWVLQEFIQLGPSFPDSLRDFIISLILPKVIDIDRSSNLLGMITKTYSDISFQFTDEQLGGNIHLQLLSDEPMRKRFINESRHELPSQVVQIARLALKQHKEFLQRDQIRQTTYETFLATQSFSNSSK